MGQRHLCDHFIPLARGELTDLLCTDKTIAEGERQQFRRLAEMVAAVYHLEYNRRLVELKAAYAPFDPDTDNVSLLPLSSEQRQARLNDLFSDFAWMLERAAGTAGASDAPIGWLPRPQDLNTSGLNAGGDALRELLSVDSTLWRKETAEVRKYLTQYGDRLPAALLQKLDEVEARLK